MSPRKRRHVRTPTDNNTQSVAQRIQAEREKLLGAAGIIACCILACDSKLTPQRVRPNLLYVLEASHGIINDSASKLGEFCHPPRRVPSRSR